MSIIQYTEDHSDPEYLAVRAENAANRFLAPNRSASDKISDAKIIIESGGALFPAIRDEVNRARTGSQILRDAYSIAQHDLEHDQNRRIKPVLQYCEDGDHPEHTHLEAYNALSRFKSASRPAQKKVADATILIRNHSALAAKQTIGLETALESQPILSAVFNVAAHDIHIRSQARNKEMDAASIASSSYIPLEVSKAVAVQLSRKETVNNQQIHSAASNGTHHDIDIHNWLQNVEVNNASIALPGSHNPPEIAQAVAPQVRRKDAILNLRGRFQESRNHDQGGGRE